MFTIQVSRILIQQEIIYQKKKIFFLKVIQKQIIDTHMFTFHVVVLPAAIGSATHHPPIQMSLR